MSPATSRRIPPTPLPRRPGLSELHRGLRGLIGKRAPSLRPRCSSSPPSCCRCSCPRIRCAPSTTRCGTRGAGGQRAARIGRLVQLRPRNHGVRAARSTGYGHRGRLRRLPQPRPAQRVLRNRGEDSFEGEAQHMKVPHNRNMVQKIGMFGVAGDRYGARVSCTMAPSTHERHSCRQGPSMSALSRRTTSKRSCWRSIPTSLPSWASR